MMCLECARDDSAVGRSDDTRTRERDPKQGGRESDPKTGASVSLLLLYAAV
jgi:hypothetical protein